MYRYEELRPKLFTEEGLAMFTTIRDHVRKVLEKSGAITMGCAIDAAGVTGDSWTMMACVDHMVERGELVEIAQPDPSGQGRVFVIPRSR